MKRVISILLCTFILVASILSASAEFIPHPGDTITLRCNHGVGDYIILDGHPRDGTVGLVPVPTVSGINWKVVDLGDGSVGIYCLGNIDGNRWLNGNTGAHSVNLAPNTTGKKYIGTHWKMVALSDGCIGFYCLGTDTAYRWLEGNSRFKLVGLASDTTNDPGTHWHVH